MQKPGVQQRLESTNLPFHEAVWETAKRCEVPYLTFTRYLTYQTQRDREGRKKMTMIQKPSEKPKQVHIDIVARNGLEWIKVSTVTEKRLLFEMAKLGWRNGEDSDTETPEEEEDKLSLVKTAEDCCVRAKAIRINYRNPTVRFVFTRLQRGHTDEIDDVLAKIAATGAIVQCANEMSSPPTFEEALPRMLTAEFTSFSPVLNIDCTILLALVSDVSHRPGIEAPWVNSAVKKQIDAERGESLLSTLLYPALTGRPLVCTASAAQRMREIVQTIGLDDERRRTEILMGYVDAPSPAQLREEFAKLSQHPVPDALRLPIQVMQGAAFQVVPAGLPAHLYEPVRRGMTALNLSVFAYGWATGCTTITSNGTVAKKIRERVEMNRRRHEERGPDVWVCPVSRSLVGKMKNKTLPQYREYAGHYY
ncbi:hypothetical protein M501DRAFT_936467 [Patellaria atrata CBS 101060]|uniref:DUF1308 domain-containing protein n=1 Tax=Patellaria atrata CBS 101060 TaxID=1346257 RepID=A0A9P4S8Q6_9PEZI|nr:hypothetical protein M501DRAFT_936467 [Patellaria atrata CBS 101060]